MRSTALAAWPCATHLMSPRASSWRVSTSLAMCSVLAIFYNLKIWVFTDPSGQYEMMPASVENKTWVQDQFAKVVPDVLRPLTSSPNALDLKPDVVFFLTPADLMTKNQVDEILTQAGQTRIHVIELGQGPDLGKLSQRRRLATATGGTYRSIDVTNSSCKLQETDRTPGDTTCDQWLIELNDD